MKRFCCLAVLTLFSSSAHAGEAVSFVVAGHRIHIEASRFCRSASCASISISGIYGSRGRRAPLDDDDRAAAQPVKTPPAVSSVPAAPPACPPPALPAAPPAVFKTAAVATPQLAAPPPPPPPIQPARIAPPPPPAPPPVERPAEIVRPAPLVAPQASKVAHEVEDDSADTPIGDWQTEGKGSVRIAQCGRALCGYVLNPSSNDKGEAVLINMKPDTNSKWTGNVSSHDSGDIYYGTMEMTGPNTLRVEACALGRFYCSGNAWSRIVTGPDRLITSRQTSLEPRS